MKIIQQWQTVGRTHPKLLEDESLKSCKKLGITSLQSYVCWSEIEKKPRIFDFSIYDELVEKLGRYGLKWTPFLVAGPYYATPAWFRNSKHSVYAKCLEHGKETGSQSIWNPYLPKYISRFILSFSTHYAPKIQIIDGVLLGISGNWGEAIFPASNGFILPPKFHTHPGWWCGDVFARLDFKKFVKNKYGSLEKLNRVWRKNFKSYEEIEYPDFLPSFIHWFQESLSDLVQFIRKHFSSTATCWDKWKFSSLQLKYPSLGEFREYGRRLHWLDFTHWYTQSMLRWAAFWLKTCRKYLPSTDIYLVTGGDGCVHLGAHFSQQARISSKYGAGIRLTNQGDSYVQNFVLGRWVSTACKFYDTSYVTEEALWNSPLGVVSRIYDAVTSGACGIYFKDLISTDAHTRFGFKYPQLGKFTSNAVKFVENVRYFKKDDRIVEVAVFIPYISVSLSYKVLFEIYSGSIFLRDFFDFDLVDEQMIEDDILQKYRFLIHLDGEWTDARTLRKIKKWITEGGIFVSCQKLRNVEEPVMELPTSKIGDGYHVKARLHHVADLVLNKEHRYPWTGIPNIDGARDGIYATLFRDRILYYNSTLHSKVKSLNVEKMGLQCRVEIPAHSIAEVYF